MAVSYSCAAEHCGVGAFFMEKTRRAMARADFPMQSGARSCGGGGRRSAGNHEEVRKWRIENKVVCYHIQYNHKGSFAGWKRGCLVGELALEDVVLAGARKGYDKRHSRGQGGWGERIFISEDEEPKMLHYEASSRSQLEFWDAWKHVDGREVEVVVWRDYLLGSDGTLVDTIIELEDHYVKGAFQLRAAEATRGHSGRMSPARIMGSG